MQRSRLTEIFHSLQGESTTIGLPTVFVRLTGCPLRCQYCDTAYAFSGGQWWQHEDILAEVAKYNCQYVTVSGGEPLAQKSCNELLMHFCEVGYHVSLETSGAMDISVVDPRVMIVMDLKTPGSHEADRNLWSNLEYLKPSDQIKFVLCDRNDFDWAVAMMHAHRLSERCQILFSPSYEQLPATQLADWIVTEQVTVRFQIQLHKFLWGDKEGK